MTYQQFLTEIQLQIHSLFDTDVTIQLHYFGWTHYSAKGLQHFSHYLSQ